MPSSTTTFDRDALVDAILRLRATPWRYVVSISGGGTAFLSDYLSVPGASKSFLEGVVPYSTEATVDFLGFRPENFCSEKTARLLASAALRRAIRLDSIDRNGTDAVSFSPDFRLVGVGATASLVSDRPKKGARRVRCAIQTFFQTFSATLNLQNGSRTRPQEERLAADFILSTLLFATKKAVLSIDDAEKLAAANGVGREKTTSLPLTTSLELFPEDDATISWASLDARGAAFLFGFDSTTFSQPFEPIGAIRFSDGKLDKIRLSTGEERDADGAVLAETSENSFLTLYPGSFDPPHRGHRKIAELAAEKSGSPVAFELSARNVDKPPLDVLEILRRVEALRETAPNVPVWLTNSPRFVEKAELFPGATFAIGTDSLVRLADPKYESGSVERRDAVLERLAASGVRFLVFARKIDGELVPPEALDLPPRLRELCEFESPDDFLDDISSSKLRADAVREAR